MPATKRTRSLTNADVNVPPSRKPVASKPAAAPVAARGRAPATTTRGKAVPARTTSAAKPPAQAPVPKGVDQKIHDALQDKLTSTEEQLTAEKTMSSELRNQLITTGDNLVRQLDDSREVYAREKAALQSERTQLQTELEAKLRALNALEQEIAEFKVMKQDLEREVESITEQLQKSKELCTKKDQRITDVEFEVAQREEQLSHLRKDLITKETDLLHHKTQINHLESTIANAQKENNGMNMNLHQQSTENERLRAELEEANTKLMKGEVVRRQLYNVIEELKGNIRVYARIKPEAEAELSTIKITDTLDFRTMDVQQSRDNATSTGRCNSTHNFKFDRVFAPSTAQEDVFEYVGPLVDSAIDGYKVCVFAYGQTGSGKTYTMEGGLDGEHRGIIPRALEKIFNTTEELTASGWKHEVTCSFVEIYNDIFRDLLREDEAYHRQFEGGKDGGKHVVRHSATDTVIDGVISTEVKSSFAVERLLSLAVSNRSTAKTKMNDRSSRSHCVFTLKFEGFNAALSQRSSGVLCFIDLAGSERVHESGAISDPARLKEAVAINKSLSHLGDVISALGTSQKKEEASHIPFRNCKLTYLLQNYLGGDGSKTLMFVNVSSKEDHVAETVNSLRFASKVNSTVIGTAKKRIQSV